jgi:predicted secreted Zn-dependent protease
MKSAPTHSSSDCVFPHLLSLLAAATLASGCDSRTKIAPDAPPMSRAPAITERFVPLDLSGSTAEELDRAITLAGHPGEDGKRYGANTDCNLRYRYRPEVREGRCRVAEVISEAEIVYTLPAWKDGDAADPALRARWKGFRAAVEAHERGHGRLCAEAIGEVRSRILAVEEQPGCDLLKVAVERTFGEVRDRFARRSSDYDVRTDHGATSGASPRALYP